MRRATWPHVPLRITRPRPLSRHHDLRPHPVALRRRQQSTATSTTTTCSSANASTPPSLSPTLLQRARALSAEHAQLVALQSENYSTTLAIKAGRLSKISDALRAYDAASTALTELDALIADPTTDPSLLPLAREDLDPALLSLSTATAQLRRALVPAHPFAHLPCLLEIRPGAGGGEAALFAADLARMYTGWLGRRGRRHEVLKCEDAEGTAAVKVDAGRIGAGGGVLECVIEVVEPGAYGELRGESGVHRVQRVPSTEDKGRTHTSSASVMVLPGVGGRGAGEEEVGGEEGKGGEGEEGGEASLVEEKDVRTDIMRARGAGGQHVNTTNSAVRLTHAPTGVVVAIQDQRSQHKNREKAWKLLRAKVAAIRREEKEEEIRELRRGTGVVAGKFGREHKIRTYNWGQQRVTDHRSGFSVHDLDDVVEGGEGLDRVMESVRGWMEDQEVAALEAEEQAKGRSG